jgi:hypothetical protein
MLILIGIFDKLPNINPLYKDFHPSVLFISEKLATYYYNYYNIIININISIWIMINNIYVSIIIMNIITYPSISLKLIDVSRLFGPYNFQGMSDERSEETTNQSTS